MQTHHPIWSCTLPESPYQISQFIPFNSGCTSALQIPKGGDMEDQSISCVVVGQEAGEENHKRSSWCPCTHRMTFPLKCQFLDSPSEWLQINKTHKKGEGEGGRFLPRIPSTAAVYGQFLCLFASTSEAERATHTRP